MARNKRKNLFHGELRKQFGKAIATPSGTGAQTITVPIAEGDVFTVSTKGSVASQVTLDLIDAYPGAEVVLLLTSAVASDAWASTPIKLAGTAATSDLVVALDDNAINLLRIVVLSTKSGASKVVVTKHTVA